MTSTVLAISVAYVVIGVLLLTTGLSSRFAWWVKAAAIVVTSVFFVEVFFATKDLLGWPRSGQLPARFQLLWVRVVEPDAMIGDRGAIYLWIEDLYGESVAEVEQSLRTGQAPDDVSSLLGLAPSETVIEVQRIYRLSSGVIGEVARNLYPVGGFELTMTLRRSKA